MDLIFFSSRKLLEKLYYYYEFPFPVQLIVI